MPVVALLVLFAQPLAATGAHAISLKEAVRRAISGHPSIAAARSNRDATAYELRQAPGPVNPLAAHIGI